MEDETCQNCGKPKGEKEHDHEEENTSAEGEQENTSEENEEDKPNVCEFC